MKQSPSEWLQKSIKEQPDEDIFVSFNTEANYKEAVQWLNENKIEYRSFMIPVMLVRPPTCKNETPLDEVVIGGWVDVEQY